MYSCLGFHQKIIVHIPEKHFKTLRYYGIYAKHHKQDKKLHKCISYEKKRYLRTLLNWRHSFFFLLDMILLNVQSVALLCWCWKFTTKKLHYLNDTEKSWAMDKPISTCAFSIVKQCSHTKKTKSFIIKVIAKSPTFALLLCPFLFLIHYTLFFTI